MTKAYIVGGGPGDPGLLTLRAAEVLRSANLLLYDALISQDVLDMVPSHCERVFVGKRGGKYATDQGEIAALMIAGVRAGKTVVRLKGGDPFVFGRGGEEALALHEAGIAFEIVPGVSSALAVPAYAGIPLTQRGYSAWFTVVTGREDPDKTGAHVDWKRIADPDGTIVVLMGLAELANVVARLIAHGLPPSHPVAVIENGTLPTARTVQATLGTIVAAVQDANIAAPSIVVIGRVVALRKQIAWRPDAAST